MTSLSLLCGEHYADIVTFLTQILMGALFVSFWLGISFCLVAHYAVSKEVLGSLLFLEDYILLYQSHEVNINIVTYCYSYTMKITQWSKIFMLCNFQTLWMNCPIVSTHTVMDIY
jgi:hypothetical protein